MTVTTFCARTLEGEVVSMNGNKPGEETPYAYGRIIRFVGGAGGVVSIDPELMQPIREVATTRSSNRTS
ncbi:MAG: hypothetical protein A2V62_04445 [Nitrospirae bacterium RBG_19FT_COMBO_58_9]|nr:MAG: hypothetical protein A2V62_04445 [Nitrospirae bacterium RBG_19FT_COMBO_58_9]